MSSRVVLSTLLFFAIGGTAGDPPATQSEIIFDGLDRIRISWVSEPGEVYSLQSTTNLAEPWQDLQTDPPVLVATTNLLAYELVVASQMQFFRVGWVQSVTGMVWIPAGTFTMGSPSSEPDRWSDEGPQTTVTISKGFWLGKDEVTQQEYLAVMGTNPSYFTGDLDRPVEEVSWNDAVAYCQKMTDQERAAGRLPGGYEYRLPTEAQWEYACRAGTTTATAFGNTLSSTQANFDGNYPYNGGAVGPELGRTTKVGSYAPNGWGLYDMRGNVWEWCLDWYADPLPGGSVTDPKGPSSGSDRVVRGGGWINPGQYCRSAIRGGDFPGHRIDLLGFRVALVSVKVIP